MLLDQTAVDVNVKDNGGDTVLNCAVQTRPSQQDCKNIKILNQKDMLLGFQPHKHPCAEDWAVPAHRAYNDTVLIPHLRKAITAQWVGALQEYFLMRGQESEVLIANAAEAFHGARFRG